MDSDRHDAIGQSASDSHALLDQTERVTTPTQNLDGAEQSQQTGTSPLQSSPRPQQNYPEPSRTSYDPYPVLRRTTGASFHIPATHGLNWVSSNLASAQNGSIPGSSAVSSDALPASSTAPSSSVYGAFPGSQTSPPRNSSYGSWPGSRSYGAFPGSNGAGSSSSGSSTTNGPTHHITDFGAFGDSRRPLLPEPAHLAPVTPLEPMADAGRVACHLAARYGELEEAAELPPQVRSRDRTHVDGGESMSHLAGIWDNAATQGGRAHAQRAWRAAITYGGMYEYDANVDEARDPELQMLFEEADLPLFKRRGPQNRPGRGRGGWRRLLKGTTHENVGRRDTDMPRKTRSTRPRGTRVKKWVDPGRQFKDYLAKANKAYVDNDLVGAADHARQAIKANPEVYQAYSLLSEILTKLGDAHASVETMKMAAITAHTVEVWTMTADRILQHAGENRSRPALKDALDCYNEALKIGPAIRDKPELEYELRVAKLELYRELEDARGSRFECKHILAKFPERTEYCREYAALCAAWQDRNEVAKAKEAYDKAFEIYQDHDNFGDPNDPTDPWSHLNIYLELTDLLGAYEEGIKRGKQLGRWFLGRKDETFWDQFEDDREFDSQNWRRRDVDQWRLGKCTQDMSRYGDGLPVDIKVRLGLLRLKMGVHHHQEAIKHFRPLLEHYVDFVEDYYDLFKLAAIALREGSFFADAAEYFDPLRTMPDAGNPDKIEMRTWLNFGICYEILSRPEDAITCFEVVAGQHRGDSYPKACAKLAKLYEDKGETDRARFLANEVIKLNQRELLYDAKVRMVPVLHRSLNVQPGRLPFEVRYAVPKPKRTPSPDDPTRAPKPLRELRPAGAQWPPLPTEQTFAASLAAKEDDVRRRSSMWDPSLVAASPFASDAMPSASASPPVFSPESSRPGTPAASGPLHGDIELPKAKRKRGPRPIKKTALARLGGGSEDEESGDEYDAATGYRPKRRCTKREGTLTKAAEEHARRYRHISDANERAAANLTTCERLRPALKDKRDEAAVADWVAGARSMLDTFTSMKLFFPGGVNFLEARDSEDPNILKTKGIHRDQLTGPQEFLKIPFTEWHRVFVELTLYHADNGDQLRCYEMLQKVLFAATPFVKTDLEWINYATAIQCGLTFNDSQYLIEIARKISADSDYRSPMAAQLFAALNRFPYGSNWFTAGPTQKWMLRLVRIFDFVAMTPQQRVAMDWSSQGPSLFSRADKVDNEPNKPVEPDVQVLLTYGHMVAQSNHSHSAFPYYYRALALDPDNVAVHLSIATMWIQNSMKRQADNRQFGITQGLAFLYRYYDLRIASGKACHVQEAEYNIARMWHYLGLTHLALPAYEKVLGLSKQVQAERSEDDGPLDQDIEDFAFEAAFALQSIYSLAGNQEAARAIAEEWLVF